MEEYSYARHHAEDIRKRALKHRKASQDAIFEEHREHVEPAPFRPIGRPRLRSCA